MTNLFWVDRSNSVDPQGPCLLSLKIAFSLFGREALFVCLPFHCFKLILLKHSNRKQTKSNPKRIFLTRIKTPALDYKAFEVCYRFRHNYKRNSCEDTKKCENPFLLSLLLIYFLFFCPHSNQFRYSFPPYFVCPAGGRGRRYGRRLFVVSLEIESLCLRGLAKEKQRDLREQIRSQCVPRAAFSSSPRSFGSALISRVSSQGACV